LPILSVDYRNLSITINFRKCEIPIDLSGPDAGAATQPDTLVGHANREPGQGKMRGNSEAGIVNFGARFSRNAATPSRPSPFEV
jgi:hypothetical protein